MSKISTMEKKSKESAFKSDTVSKTFGSSLRKIRNKKGLSLEDVEGIIGIQAAHLARLERGESSANARTIVKLCKGLKIQPNDLFKGLI